MRRQFKGDASEVLRFFARFKSFALPGGFVELTLGALFYNITYALASNILMPIIGLGVFGFDLSNLTITLKEPVVVEGGKQLKEAVKIELGSFIETVLQFIMVALAIFLFFNYCYPKIAVLLHKQPDLPAARPEVRTAAHAPENSENSDTDIVEKISSALVASQSSPHPLQDKKTQEELLLEIKELLQKLTAGNSSSSAK